MARWVNSTMNIKISYKNIIKNGKIIFTTNSYNYSAWLDLTLYTKAR